MNAYKKIKNQNGEAFAKAILHYDNGIFELPNIVGIVKFAGYEAEPMLNYLTSLKKIEIPEEGTSVFFGDLLNEAGYEYVVADSPETQDAIKKYFAPGNELCTFGTDRYKRYYIVNVWKKDADQIQRENKPVRDGLYGTSVMSIQIAKSGGFISIKNRYNHAVSYCDNTLYSNPDNIIPGLSMALKEHFQVKFSSSKAKIEGNFTICKDRIFRYNYETYGIYIGEKAYIKDGEIFEVDPDKELILDYFILNLQTKKVTCIPKQEDSFPQALEKELQGKRIRVSINVDDVEAPGEFLIIKEK